MSRWQIGHGFRQHLETHQETMQRVFVQFVGATEKLVEQLVFPLDVTLQKW